VRIGQRVHVAWVQRHQTGTATSREWLEEKESEANSGRYLNGSVPAVEQKAVR
jgi:hypothetical protein